MNKFASTLLQLLLLIVFFVFDKASNGIFSVFDYFSLTVIYLIILLQLNSPRSYISIFFLFGFLVDWYNKSYLGMSSLLSITILFVYNIVVRRFAGNKASLSGLNFVTSYLLFETWIGFSSFFSLQSFVFSLISLGITSLFWLRN